MNLLFICSRNQWRSPTAERIFDCPDYPSKSAGISGVARIKLNEKLVIWADLIFVMEKRHRTVVQERFPYELAGKKIIVLDISDDYQFMDEELIEILKNGVEPYL
ncbi:low molecular weight protein tyrosine phosphatase family protein [Dyadobacter sp. NIV53]|uniref:low molecular weight protein tyrosine phosphatase family protein n=1 Tax=Dyadobacter sp. NIV53 TaxID=2861765 RepID=UPI001C86C496|nr:protein tyrosine phosphatase [Dyadobacter sp. NIV53]